VGERTDEAAVDVDAEGAARAEVGDEGEGDDPLVAADVEEAAALEPLPVHELEAGVVLTAGSGQTRCPAADHWSGRRMERVGWEGGT